MSKKAIVVAGVAGCGKSTIAQALAEYTGWDFIEADDFHSAQSKQKMATGQPLNDEDRTPWLKTLNREMLRRAPVILACSALKQLYRDVLSENLHTQFVWINLSRELAVERVSARQGHFMPASLVDSQFATAEVPDEALFLDAAKPIESLIQQSIEALNSFCVNKN